MKKAILFGATGFIGSQLLHELLNDTSYELVTIVVRKPVTIKHPRLKVVIGDFRSLPGLKGDLAGDDIFIALGTTKKHTPDQKDYYQVDHDLPVLAATIAKDHGATAVFVVSAVGANSKSGVFYTRTKGDLERDIIRLNFEHTHIFEPSMIKGNRSEHRAGEKFFIGFFDLVSPLLIGNLDKYKSIDGKDVAKAMHSAAKNRSQKVKVYHWKDMMGLLQGA